MYLNYWQNIREIEIYSNREGEITKINLVRKIHNFVTSCLHYKITICHLLEEVHYFTVERESPLLEG